MYSISYSKLNIVFLKYTQYLIIFIVGKIDFKHFTIYSFASKLNMQKCLVP
jgi:hypothetical protein